MRTNTAFHTGARKNPFLLVVDSDADSLVSLSMLLRRFDYHVRVARTAEEALLIAAETVPTVVITATGLADISGLELVRQFRLVPGCKRIPVLILRRAGESLHAKDFFYHGVTGCLSCPVAIEELYRAIQESMEPVPRRNIRIKTLLPIHASTMQHDCFEDACTTDLSERGMFVRSTKPIEVHTRFSCRIQLQGRAIEVDAAVLYHNRGRDGAYYEPGMGVEFVRIAPHDQRFIRQFIREEITKGLSPPHMQ